MKLLLTAFIALLALAAVADQPFRDRGRVMVEGTIRSVTPDRGGYHVRLAGNDTRFWVPDDVLHGRTGGLRAGVSVRFGGALRGGMVRVDAIDWLDARRYGDRNYSTETIRGIVERIDFRRGAMRLRDEVTGRRIVIDASRIDAGRGRRLRDLHSGDRVEISGRWMGETFVAGRIEPIFDRHRGTRQED